MEEGQDPGDRGAPSNLRGWLSDVYLPALCAGELQPLLRRLGDRATVDDPLFGRASGPEAVARRLADVAQWLSNHRATFERSGFVLGSDRDVTEGLLVVVDAAREARTLPVGIVAERRPEREVAVRVYHTTSLLGLPYGRRSTLDADHEVVPPPADAFLDALRRADVDALVASFEAGATVRDAQGTTLTKGDGPQLRAYFADLVGGGASDSGIELACNARVDDGRTCALEWTLLRVRGRGTAPMPGLAVFERGETGLLHSLRFYDGFAF